MNKTLLVIFFGLNLYANDIHCQMVESELLVKVAFASAPKSSRSEKRGFFVADKKGIQLFNPLLYLSGGMMYAYQNVISPMLVGECQFQISCSEYAKRKLESQGVLAGVYYGAYRLNTCHPKAFDSKTPYLRNESTGKLITDERTKR